MKTERNAPCACGSGKKYKQCCQTKVESSSPAPRAPTPAEINQLVALFHAGRYAELESQSNLLLERHLASGLAWKLLCASLQMQGKDALHALRKAAEFLPNDAEAHNNLGSVLQDLGQLDAAVASYRRALKINPDDPAVHNNLGTALQDLGQFTDAVTSYRQALKIEPHYAEAYNNLGIALQDLGQLDGAVASYRQALKIKPDYAEAYCGLGIALKNLGQTVDAVASFHRALEIKPNYAEAHTDLGNALLELGQLDDALASYRRALEIKPDYAEAHSNLGNALLELGQLDEAVASYRRALEIKPDYAIAHNNLANALRVLGQLDSAAASCRLALGIQPDYADAHNNLGSVLQALGQFDGAIASYHRALEIKPDYAEAYSNLGKALKDIGRLDDAVASCRKAVEIKPDYVEAHNNLGNALLELGQLDGAVACYRQALKIKPDYAEAHCNLGNALGEIGQLDAAIASYHQALAHKPDSVDARGNLLFALNYTASHASFYCLEAAREYGRIVSQKALGRFDNWQCQTEPERLRVGLVSGDLHNHPVGYFLESLLAHLVPARVELIAYPTSRTADELTARIKHHFSAWKPLTGKSDEAAAQLIHADGVHILLDLSGHTDKNRLPMFAWKPAPVQASWLGYFATTGVAEIDYFLADEVGVPEGQRERFTETVWYLPDTRLCFTPPDVDLPIANLPALVNGHPTFGCFQNVAKVGDEVLMAWGAILTALPGSRLRWQCKTFRDPAVVTQTMQRLQQRGIEPARVLLLGTVSRVAYLAAHAEVDMILDTFPYPGGTTTCEALWMGVPTLTLAGDTLLARQGASLLTAAGLWDWVATSKSDYVGKAINLASDLPKLADLRAGLRVQVSTSPLFDAPRFARNLEQALWGMWRKWQARK